MNPAHMEPVTAHENKKRGLVFGIQNGLITHCPQGHEYTQDNLRVEKRGFLRCRECANASCREYYWKAKSRASTSMERQP
jgi:hypothetical protein